MNRVHQLLLIRTLLEKLPKISKIRTTNISTQRYLQQELTLCLKKLTLTCIYQLTPTPTYRQPTWATRTFSTSIKMSHLKRQRRICMGSSRSCWNRKSSKLPRKERIAQNLPRKIRAAPTRAAIVTWPREFKLKNNLRPRPKTKLYRHRCLKNSSKARKKRYRARHENNTRTPKRKKISQRWNANSLTIAIFLLRQ